MSACTAVHVCLYAVILSILYLVIFLWLTLQIYTDHPSSRAGQPVAAPRQKQRQGASANGDLSTVAELSNSEHISTTHNPGHDRHHHPPAESSQREDANEPGGFVLADGSSPYMATGSSSGGWSTSATSATMSSTMSGSSTERPYRDRDLDSVPSIHYPPVDSMSSESEGNFLGKWKRLPSWRHPMYSSCFASNNE